MKRRIYYSIIALLLLLSTAIAVSLQSRVVLQWLWKGVEVFTHQAVTAQRIDGVLAGPITIEGLLIRTPSSDIAIASGKVDWHPGKLLSGRLSVIETNIPEIIITLHPSEKKAPSTVSVGVALPFILSAGELAVDRLVIRSENADIIKIDNIAIADAEWHGDRVWADRLTFDLPWGSISAHGNFATQSNTPIDFQARFTPNRSFIDAPLELAGELKGTLGHPQFSQTLTGAVHGNIQGDIVWYPGQLHWQAVADIDPFSIRQLRSTWRPLMVGGHLEGSGDFLRNELRSEFTLGDRVLGRWNGKVSLKQDHAQLEIVEAQVLGNGHAGRIDGHGKLRLASAPNYVTDAAIDLRWRDLAWPVTGRDKKVLSSDGSAHLSGSLSDYRVTTDLALATPNYPPSRWQVKGAGDLHHFNSPSVQLQALNGRASGEASIIWSPHLVWHAHLDGKGLEPGNYWKQWPGRLDIAVRSDGSWKKTHSLNIDVQSLRGSLRGYPVTGNGRLDYLDGRWNVAALQLSSGSANLSASGALLQPWDLAWQLDAPQLGNLLTDARGRLKARGTINGTSQQPRITVDASVDDLRWKQFSAHAATFITDIDLADLHPWQLRLSGSDIRYGENTVLDHFDINGDGSADAHKISVHLERNGGLLILAADGRYSDGGWSGTLHDGLWKGRDNESLKQESPATISISKASQSLARYCWTDGEARGCIEYQPVAPGVGELNASLTSLPVQLLAEWMPRKDVHLSGKIFAEGHARFDRGLGEVTLDAHVESGALRYHHPLGRVINLQFKQFTVSLLSKEGNSRALVDVALANGDIMHMEGLMPGWSVGTPLPGSQPINGAAVLSMRDLSWMTLVIPEILDPVGAVSAQLSLSGSVEDPRLTGTLALENASVSIPRAGLSIKKLALAASSPDGVSLNLSGAATSGPGWITIEGNLRGESLDKWRSEFTLRGERFEAIRLPTVHLLASPQIRATIEPHRLDVEGTLQVPESDIKLPEFPETARKSSDVVLINGSEHVKQPERWAINTRLTLQLGDYVKLEGYGFKGRIGGQLTITEKPDALATGQGELSVHDGHYKAYGRDLTIDSGRLLFANSPIDNPALDVRASRKKDEVTVGVNITGRLQSPELRLFSEPAMEESDALAYLVLGHPLRSASSSEATSVTAAATSIGLVGGERIASTIGKEFGIEEVSVGSEYQSKEGALLLGKYLSPRLYLQYAVVFSDALNITRLRYELTNHWYIKAESGEQQSADILYTFER